MESSGSQGVGANINSFSHMSLVDVKVKMQVVISAPTPDKPFTGRRLQFEAKHMSMLPLLEVV